MAAGSTNVPGATLPVGTTDLPAANVPGGKISSLALKVDTSLFTDPATTITVSLECKIGGVWSKVSSITQVGSPTGRWGTKFGDTNFGVSFEIVFGSQVNVTQVRASVDVVGSPVTFGAGTLSWT